MTIFSLMPPLPFPPPSFPFHKKAETCSQVRQLSSPICLEAGMGLEHDWNEELLGGATTTTTTTRRKQRNSRKQRYHHAVLKKNAKRL